MVQVVFFATALLLSTLPATASICDYPSQFCGRMHIPYPFGMSSSCGLPDFRIDCKNNSLVGDGPLPFLQIGTPETRELQVLDFSTTSLIVNSTDLKAMPRNNNCSASGHVQFGLHSDGPFVLSANNIFLAIGCNSNGYCSTDSEKTKLVSCSTGCYKQFALPYCAPYSCCVTALPPDSRHLDFTGNGVHDGDFSDVCGFSTVLSPETFVSTEYGSFGRAGHYGLNISWGIVLDDKQNCSTVNSTEGFACANNSRCIDVGRVPGYACSCNEGYKGDGYKDGLRCEDIDECLSGDNDCEPPPLGLCTNTPGSYNCSCINGWGDGRKGNCTIGSTDPRFSLKSIVIVGVVVALVTLGLVLLFVGALRAWTKHRKEEENFRRNGGKHFVKNFYNTSNRNLFGRRNIQAQLFTSQELEIATRNYSVKVGSGGFGTVYRGTLAQSHRIVAVKKADRVQMDGKAIQHFINEIILLGQVTHPNIVELIGCCLHTAVPILVYEYINNGTLAERLRQVRNDDNPLSWATRLLIAKQTAEGLAHLHNISPPVFHRDIKSSNILLDHSYTPKIADFGASHLLPEGQTHQSVETLVFTVGYMDPEYYSEGKFSDKSDVYSFGVVLLELITALPPVFSQSSLVDRCVAKGELKDLMDHSIVEGREKQVMSSVRQVAKLATRCLEREGRRRPSMRQVCQSLGKIEAKFRKTQMQVDVRKSAGSYPQALYQESPREEDESDFLLESPLDVSNCVGKSSLELPWFPSFPSYGSSTQHSLAKSISKTP